MVSYESTGHCLSTETPKLLLSKSEHKNKPNTSM